MKHIQIYLACRAIVQEGSIRKAAESMGLSASALNRQIASLEADLGIALFDRRATGVRLSTAGEIYYRHFIEHIARLDSAKITVADLQGARIGHVTVAVSPELAHGFFPSEINKYRELYPRVTFTALPSGPRKFEAQLTQFEADLALIAQPDITDGIDILAAVDLPLCGVGDHSALPLDLLEEADLILPARSLSLRSVIDQAAKRKRLSLRPMLETTNLIQPGAIPEGAVQIWLKHDLPDPSQGLPLPALDHPHIHVVLGHRRGHSLSIAAAKFADQIVERWQNI
ncbi:MAG: LysR family transcriptional regulator [Pseudomonadota bacterium]